MNESLAERLQEALIEPSRLDFRLAVEELARSSLASRGFDIDAFAGVMRALPLTFDELYEIYVAKNVLNMFRQANGYRTGEYRKVWDGREDNETPKRACRAPWTPLPTPFRRTSPQRWQTATPARRPPRHCFVNLCA